MESAAGNTLQQWIDDEKGQDLVEYALLAGVIGLGAVAFLSSFSRTFTNTWYAMIEKAAQYWP